MDNKKIIGIRNSDGTKENVELITYLYNEDNNKSYIVYSKGQKTGNDGDEIIYISRIESSDEISCKIDEIVDDNEWLEVQQLLKKIANA